MAGASHSSAFKDYQARLQQPLKIFEEFFQSQIESFEPEIREVVRAVLTHPGKRLRPLFVFASGGVLQKPTPQALRLAAIVEFIHLATLVHDDILDEAQTRHNQPAHHRLYSAKVSVLTGDTLFLRANELAAMEEEVWVGRLVSAAAKATCTGEIAQGLRENNTQPLPFDDYARQISLKTGKLFGLSCALGGYLAKASDLDRNHLARYGERFGMAYQMYDDAVDIWGKEADFNKTLGTDQLQHKWTLPWILLAQANPGMNLAPLWVDPQLAHKALMESNIWTRCQTIFDDNLHQASHALEGQPQEALLKLPLEFVKNAWTKLDPTIKKSTKAVNE